MASSAVHQNCIKCGIEFCLPREVDRQRRYDHKEFYCPNGHRQWYIGKTKEEVRIELLEQEVDYLKDEVRYEQNRLEEHHNEFARCPIKGCIQRHNNYHYSSMKKLFLHLGRKHGIVITIPGENKELTA